MQKRIFNSKHLYLLLYLNVNRLERKHFLVHFVAELNSWSLWDWYSRWLTVCQLRTICSFSKPPLFLDSCMVTLLHLQSHQWQLRASWASMLSWLLLCCHRLSDWFLAIPHFQGTLRLPLAHLDNSEQSLSLSRFVILIPPAKSCNVINTED